MVRPPLWDTLPPDPDLERTIPKAVFGHPTEQLHSIMGQASQFETWNYPLLDCAPSEEATVHFAHAWWPGLDGVEIDATRIDGVGGSELQAWYVTTFPYGATASYGGAPPAANWAKRSSGSKTYLVDQYFEIALYPTQDTLYVISQGCCVDWIPSPPPSLPPSEAIRDEIVRLLP